MAHTPITIHVISDSLGETADMVARAAASQFAQDAFRIERLPKVSTPEQLTDEVYAHCGEHCIFFFTLVDEALRREMAVLKAGGVNCVDLLGPAVNLLQDVTGYQPAHEAGAVRRTDEEYFDRIEAMEFAVKHDDGRNPEGLKDADVVLIGVSRTSKTPLSMYLATKGFRVANIPLAPGSAPPHELFEVDPAKVFGLITRPDVLIDIRNERMRELGTVVPRYADREMVEREMEEARALMRRLGCLLVHTDNRAVEESAQEIIRHLHGGLTTKD
ncbi:MAG: kinase/pyrophosphorylase [Actinobacteria bacterium]|nr:MAG: kinase/pyrophosphorylase [Actinomycetota bacterium]